MTKLEQLQEMEKRMDSMTLKQQDAVFDEYMKLLEQVYGDSMESDNLTDDQLDEILCEIEETEENISMLEEELFND